MLSGYPEHREALRALGVAVSAGFAVGQRVRHSRRRGGWPLDIWKADRSGARGSTELDAVDLDVVALTRALKHVVESAAGVAERIGPVGDDDRRLELHTGSIARVATTTRRPARFQVSLFASVPLERLRQQAGLVRPALEEVNDADGGIGALDVGLDQREVSGVAEPELVEPLGLGPAHIARGGAARRIGVLMMSNQRLPVFVSRPLDGFPDLLPGVGHVSSELGHSCPSEDAVDS